MSPFKGQGANQSMVDSLRLAMRLASGGLDETMSKHKTENNHNHKNGHNNNFHHSDGKDSINNNNNIKMNSNPIHNNHNSNNTNLDPYSISNPNPKQFQIQNHNHNNNQPPELEPEAKKDDKNFLITAILTDFVSEMIERVKPKVEMSRQAATYLHSKQVLVKADCRRSLKLTETHNPNP